MDITPVKQPSRTKAIPFDFSEVSVQNFRSSLQNEVLWTDEWRPKFSVWNFGVKVDKTALKLYIADVIRIDTHWSTYWQLVGWSRVMRKPSICLVGKWLEAAFVVVLSCADSFPSYKGLHFCSMNMLSHLLLVCVCDIVIVWIPLEILFS